MAMIDEIDLTPVFEAALKDGKKLYFPRMIPDSNDMEFYLIDNLSSCRVGIFNAFCLISHILTNCRN